MENSLKGTRTEQNLLKAFAGESQAKNRYEFFAKQAKKEGYEQMAAIVQEIDDLSESQQEESPPDPERSTEQDIQEASERADGAEKQSFGQRPAKQLTADEVLKSKEMTDRWLRDISRDPKAFVRARFQFEYANSKEGENGS